MLAHGHHHLLHGQVQLAGRGLDDADVGLVRDEPVDGGLVEAIGLQGLVDDAAQGVDRHAKDLVAAHLQIGVGVGLTPAHPLGDLQEVLVGAIGADVGGDDPRFLAGAQDHRPGAIGEQDAGGTILPVEEAGHGVRPDDQGAFGAAGADELIGDAQGIDEARADRLDIEGGDALNPQPRLDDAGRAGKDLVRGRGGEDDEIDLPGLHPGRGHRGLGRRHSQVGAALALGDHVPLADASAAEDPLVRGVDDLLQVLVGDDPLGQITAGAQNAGIEFHRVALRRSASSWPPTRWAMRSGMLQ